MKKLIIPIFLLFSFLISCNNQDSVQSPNINEMDDPRAWSLIYEAIPRIQPDSTTGWIEFSGCGDKYDTDLKFRIKRDIITEDGESNSRSEDEVQAYVVVDGDTVVNEVYQAFIPDWTDYIENLGEVNGDVYCAFKVDVPADFEDALLIKVYKQCTK